MHFQHWLQVVGSITALFEIMVIASALQTAMHFLQPVHAFESTLRYAPFVGPNSSNIVLREQPMTVAQAAIPHSLIASSLVIGQRLHTNKSCGIADTRCIYPFR
jgi:hypothetical protein